MKQLLATIILIITWLIIFNPVYARPHHQHGFEDRARVIKVKPIYQRVEIVTPEESCWEEKIITKERYTPKKNYGGLIVGGIIGGVAGHQVGRGRGKDVATVAGSILGALLGNNITHSSRVYYPPKKYIRYQTHCDTIETISYRKEIVAYKVKYRYKGHTYRTQTKNHPGKYIDVKVKVKPLRIAKR